MLNKYEKKSLKISYLSIKFTSGIWHFIYGIIIALGICVGWCNSFTLFWIYSTDDQTKPEEKIVVELNLLFSNRSFVCPAYCRIFVFCFENDYKSYEFILPKWLAYIKWIVINTRVPLFSRFFPLSSPTSILWFIFIVYKMLIYFLFLLSMVLILGCQQSFGVFFQKFF